MEQKKRRLNDSTMDEQLQGKRTRRKAGSLKDLVEMPLDVVGEIFSRLDPGDLLNLARIEKSLRAFLMSRSSISIWKRSRSNIPRLPDCPSDLSEPQYANLVFTKNCDFCLRNLSSIHISWEARVKTCTRCMHENFEAGIFDHDRGYPLSLAPFLPFMTPSKPDSDDLYYSNLDRLWRKGYEDAKDKEEWLEIKLGERRDIEVHAGACAVWQKETEIARKAYKLSLVEKNKTIIVERVKKLGWEEEFAKMSEDDVMPQDIPKVTKACQKELTDRVLLNLDKLLIEHMEDFRRERLHRDRRAMLMERLPILKDVYQTYILSLPANALHPTAGELFRSPVVQELINTSSFTKAHMETIIPILPHLTLRWQKELEDKLCQLISTACGAEYPFDPEKVLHLATTSFSCGRCSSGKSLTHPRVLVHSCATSWSRDGCPMEVDEKACNSVLEQVYWNSRGDITFKLDDLKQMQDVIQMCGLDAKTTTRLEMDEANPILECIPCNDIHRGRATLKWSAVITHKHEAHKNREMKLKVLEGQEADLARARMTEEQERRYAGKNYKAMICIHCKMKGNTTGLTLHAMKNHGIATPGREDIVPLVDSNQIPSLFYLWPPRIEESNAEKTRVDSDKSDENLFPRYKRQYTGTLRRSRRPDVSDSEGYDNIFL
ncbi:hypothetical protein GALMADRAFT_218999 [Galerina marginata CBS 339.88]|uniref:F-box domain-containing protein n=1 Tax=Galerina marginata (strain CBS 339.88) TaxID=685588 RepID=A0A067TUF1_GALM3|nr:hypothetical protein GALMADRAFT_218999 [Galerina marginata CBS 339.88]